MKLTYYLDGKKISSSELKGKSGHLKIKIDYTNNTKKSVNVSGKIRRTKQSVCNDDRNDTLNETFSNVAIDNGKVVSDGNRNIVILICCSGYERKSGNE